MHVPLKQPANSSDNINLLAKCYLIPTEIGYTSMIFYASSKLLRSVGSEGFSFFVCQNTIHNRPIQLLWLRSVLVGVHEGLDYSFTA